MSIVFQKGGLSDLTLERGRLVPYSPEEQEINQERYLTEDNNPKVVDYGSNHKTMKLAFSFLTKDNYDGATNGLRTWFEDSNIDWCMNNFTLVDENSVSYTVRLWQKKFTVKKHSNDRYSLSLIFKIE